MGGEETVGWLLDGDGGRLVVGVEDESGHLLRRIAVESGEVGCGKPKYRVGLCLAD